MTATNFFGIDEPTHEKVDAFHEQQPLAHTMTDSLLDLAVSSFPTLLMTGREIYVKYFNASANTHELTGGLFDLQGRWIAWTGGAAELPEQVRLGDLAMEAKWHIGDPRYCDEESSDSKVIIGVELYLMDTSGGREIQRFLIGHVSERMGAPLARYDTAEPQALPDRLLWMGFTVDVELDCHEIIEDPDMGSPVYRSYKLTISRRRTENECIHLSSRVEKLLKD